IIKQVKDAEAAIRGFNLTQDTAFLRPSMKERSIKIEQEYRLLRRVTADHPIQQLHLDTLKRLLDIKYRLLLRGEKGKQDDSAAVREGENYMLLIDRKVQDMIHIEEGLLHERSELLRFFSAIWIPVIFISSLVAILIGIYSYITL